MTRPASLIRNVVSNWAVLGAGIASALLLTPVVVKALGREMYGVWSFVNVLAAYSELLYLGLGSALVKFVAEAQAKNDIGQVSRLASVVASIYLGVGLLCLLAMGGLGAIVPGLFADPLSPTTASVTAQVCILLGVRLLLLFIGSGFAGVLCGHDRYDLVNGVWLVLIILRVVATPILLWSSPSPLLTLAWITMVLGSLEVIAFVVVTFRVVPGLVVRLVMPKRQELRLLYGFGVPSFFLLLAVKLISHSDLTVIGITLGAGSVALYALPLQLIDYGRMVVGGFSGVFLPRLTVLAGQGDLPGLREEFVRSARFAFFLAVYVQCLLVAIGPHFLTLWIGNEFAAQAHWVLLWLSLASALHVLISQLPLPFYQALGTVARPAVVLLIEGVANLGLSLVLAPRWGISGVAFATLVPVACLSFVILPPYLCRRLQLPFSRLIARGIAPGVFLLVAIVPANILVSYIPATSYFSLAARAALTIPVALAVFWFTFPLEDRRAALKLLAGGSRAAGGITPEGDLKG